MSLDYCFVGKKGAERMKVLMVCGGEGKAAFAHVAHKRDWGGEGVARTLVQELDLLGYTRVLLKGDQEPALKESRSKVKTE